jgi:hypothetical protein
MAANILICYGCYYGGCLSLHGWVDSAWSLHSCVLELLFAALGCFGCVRLKLFWTLVEDGLWGCTTQLGFSFYGLVPPWPAWFLHVLSTWWWSLSCCSFSWLDVNNFLVLLLALWETVVGLGVVSLNVVFYGACSCFLVSGTCYPPICI